MSVVIAIKDKDKVYLAADSQCTCGASKLTLSNPNNYKIWKTKGLDNSIMCHTGACRDLGVIRFNNFIPETRALCGDIDIEFVQGEMVYDMFDALKEHEFTESEEGPHMASGYLFAYKDKVYEISRWMYVLEIDDYTAMGSGRDSAMGSLASTEGEPIESRLLKAVIAASNIDLCVGYPIIITDTESCEFKIFDEEDIKKTLKMDNISRTSRMCL